MVIMHELKSFLGASKTGRTMLAEVEKEAVKAREDARAPMIARLAELERELGVAARHHHAAVERADVAVTAARKAVEEALREYTSAYDARSQALETLEAERKQLRESLQTSAPPALVEARRQLKSLEQSLSAHQAEVFTRRDPETKARIRYSSLPAATRRLEATRAAIADVERLQLTVLGDATDALTAIWQSVGGPDPYTAPERID